MRQKEPYILGPYSESLAQQQQSEFPKSMSFLNSRFTDIESYRIEGRSLFEEALQVPRWEIPAVQTLWEREFDGLNIMKLQWQLPFGYPTEAYYLRPAGVQKVLGAVLALHDHGGNKFHGKSKIVRLDYEPHPTIVDCQNTYYGGRAWANEFAKQGYAVLVHDVFPFESRRIRFSDVPGRVIDQLLSDPLAITELEVGDADPYRDSERVKDIDDSIATFAQYNAFSREMESVIAKAIFAAGLTWPALTLAEDRVALAILQNLAGVESSRIACCGLSLGGLRSNYLAGSTPNIAFSATIGFMTTWNDLITRTAVDHTWMVYVPHISTHMEFADILAMRAPDPAMVISSIDDPLFSHEEVVKAERQLQAVYEKSGNPAGLSFSYYPGGHRFDVAMQEEVLDRLGKTFTA